MDELLDNDMPSQSLNARVITNAPVITKTQGVYNFTKLSPEELTQKFDTFMEKKGYKLESGVSGNGIYSKGNKLMRILFGAFVKRFVWKVTIVESIGVTQLTFFKEAKGYVGGAIGVSQVNTEFKSIVNSLSQFHAKQEN